MMTPRIAGSLQLFKTEMEIKLKTKIDFTLKKKKAYLRPWQTSKYTPVKGANKLLNF